MATKNEVCYPLEFLKQREKSFNDVSTFFDIVRDTLPDTTDEDIIDYILGGDFPVEPRTDLERVVNNICKSYIIPYLSKYYSIDIDWKLLLSSKRYQQNRRTDIMDCFVPDYVWGTWARNKQVYQPDVDFLDALLNTDTVEVTADMFRHLPSNIFYIDFTKYTKFDPIVGAWIFVKVYPNVVSLFVQILSKENIFFSSSNFIYYDKDTDELQLPLHKRVEDMDGPLRTIRNDLLVDPVLNNSLSDYSKVNHALISSACLVLVTYLISQEPDIKESEVSKRTYKKPSENSPVRNKFSEIQEWNVGLRYGKQLRDWKNTKDAEIEETIQDKDGTIHQVRKPMKPHFRRGHWHKYWCGKGRKRLEIRWVMNTFVNGNQAKDVVIHE